MRFSDDFLTELRARIDIEDLIGRYVEIQGRGSRNPKALCPFHAEKTASFVIYRNTQSYYCFGCGAGGDAITFVKNIEHLDYVEAVRFLCERAGMSMPTDPVDDEYARQRRRCYEANREAARFFHAQLFTEGGGAARAYLEKRGLKKETVVHFGLGYAPDAWDGLLRHLQTKGFNNGELLSFDLAYRTKRGGVIDAFRNRLMFPIMDLRGNVIAFGGRVLDDSKPKYRNTSDTVVFKKGQGIYALNFAKDSGTRKLILCEGYMDVIAMHQAGFTNAVAGLGTAFTSEQISLLTRYCDELLLSFDADEAGKKATERALRLLASAPVKLRVLALDGGKDPDEIIKTHGREYMERIINGAKNDTEFAISRASDKYDLKTDDGKLGFLNEAVEILAGIPNAVERDLYLTRVAQMTGSSKQPLESEVKRAQKRRGMRQEREAFERDAAVAADADGHIPNPERRAHLLACRAEETLLASLIRNPDYLRRLGGMLNEDVFVTAFNREVYAGVERRIRENRELDFTMFGEDPDNETASYFAYLTVLGGRIAGTLEECRDCIRTLLHEKSRASDAAVADLTDDEYLALFRAIREKQEKKGG